MSHVPQRKEKDCLNCGTIVQGRYCHVCGQENVVPKESFWHMVTHFFYDITHFDSNFFTTVKDLILKPGFLSREYVAGRRVSYLHPVKMYVFTSAIFFLIFFNFMKPEITPPSSIEKPLDSIQRANYIQGLESSLRKDSSNKNLKHLLTLAKDTSQVLTARDIIEEDGGGLKLVLSDTDYKTVGEYDSAQNRLPSNKKDGWFKRRMMIKSIELNTKFREDPDEAMNKLGESILHRLPYMLFISLPLFALILKLVYIRRKQYFYVDHGIFTIHLYVFSFLLLLTIFTLNRLGELLHLGITGWIIAVMFLSLFFYLYKGMRKFYEQRRAKTIAKFFIVTLSSLIMMVILFILIMFFSAYTF